MAKMYGPSIVTEYNDVKFQTIQVDFEISHRFDLKYITEDDSEEYPLCINCSPVGNYEKLIRLLIEKYEGDFPFWIAPEQIMIVYEGKEFIDYAENIKQELASYDLRVNIDETNFSFEDKINYAKKMFVPYIITLNKEVYNKQKIIVNDKECELDKFIEEVLTCKAKY